MKYWYLRRLTSLTLFTCLVMLLSPVFADATEKENKFWEIQSVDTMKYSRDLARDKANDREFDMVIDRQVRDIANTGATHVAIGTPYDPEFIPFLTKWVRAARKYGIGVWFRGNFSGWEKWFDYPSVGRTDHFLKLKNFVESNPDLFADGDIFSSCPECENGGPGDPRQTLDIAGFRKFLISENELLKIKFAEIDKRITFLYSMNGDVAKLIMDPETTEKLGGIVTIDHYVASPEKLLRDIESLVTESGGKVMLGEFGVPISGINGNMTQVERAVWIEEAMRRMVISEKLVGMNYWVNVGGSTALWDDAGKGTKALEVLTAFYSPIAIRGRVTGQFGMGVGQATITDGTGRRQQTDNSGNFTILSRTPVISVMIEADNYEKLKTALEDGARPIRLKPKRRGIIMSILGTLWDKLITKRWGRIG